MDTEDHLRYMLYRPRSKEDDLKTDNVHLGGHTDFGILQVVHEFGHETIC